MSNRAATAFLSIVLSVLTSSSTAAEAEGPASLELHVENKNWNASVADVEKVLNSTAEQIMVYFPGRKLKPINVSHGQGAPITLYEKGSKGAYQVHLSAAEAYWAQYTYQFAHELCHILSNYDHHHMGKNQWFDEALCETSSLFVLSKMNTAWTTHPPYPNWKNWGVHFDHYLNDILADRGRRLPPDLNMAQWIALNLPVLATEDHLTDRSKLVAAYLFRIFQDEPDGWESLGWLNLGPNDDSLEFESYLQAWRSRVPDKHKRFVGKIQQLFGYQPREANPQ